MMAGDYLIYPDRKLCQSFAKEPSRCRLDSLFLLCCIYLAMIQVIKVSPLSKGGGEEAEDGSNKMVGGTARGK